VTQERKLELTELARREMEKRREMQIRAEQDANRKAKKGTVTEEQRRKVGAEKIRAARRKQLEEDREQL